MQSGPQMQIPQHSEKSPLFADTRPQKISVTFDMNRLQDIPGPGKPKSPGRVLVSMNPIHQPKSVHSEYIYHHPLFSAASFSAKRRLHEINGTNGVGFAGAWMGYGFHEDGFTAGLHAASHLERDVERTVLSAAPFEAPGIGWKRFLAEKLCRILVQGMQLMIVFFT